MVWRHPAAGRVALLNAYPYTSGHLMVMPIRHVGDLEELEPATRRRPVAGRRRRGRGPSRRPTARTGSTSGANLGRAAGAGVPGHLHVHVLPRWNGDTNFMTTVADTRVLPESLAETDAKLRSRLALDPGFMGQTW